MCLLLCLELILVTACNRETGWAYTGEGELTIAILSSSYTYNALSGLDVGIELAREDAEAVYGVRLNVVKYEDEARYDMAVANAKSVASDSVIAAAISVQEFNMVDSVVSILNERNKPLIVLSGCFDETADKGYDNVLFDFLSADKMGRLMGEYMLKANCSRVALLHTNTAFETDELKGLEAAVADSELLIYDIISGPYTDGELKTAIRKWKLLDIDSIFIAFYDFGLGAKIINSLRETAPEISIMGDYGLDNETILNACGDNLKGVIYPALFPVEDSFKLTSFYERCQNRYGSGVNYLYAAQLYDLLMMLTDRAAEGRPDSLQEYMGLMKDSDGYEGLVGLHRYDSETGQLLTEEKKFMIYKSNGYFETLTD